MIFILLVVALLTLPSSAKESINYQIEDLGNSTGLYQEYLGTMHVSANSWRFDVVINLTEFVEDVRILINNTKRQCENDGKRLGCESIARELAQREHSVENKMKELILMSRPHRKNKRDLLDKVGNVAHALFGVMDFDDAIKIYKAIDELTEDNND